MEIGRFVLSCLKGENNVVGKTGSIQLVDDLHDRLKVQLCRQAERNLSKGVCRTAEFGDETL